MSGRNVVCPECGREGEGAFCAACGAPLRTSDCRHCGASSAPEARFCTSCGADLRLRPDQAAAAPAPEAESTLGWWVAAGLLAALILVLGLPVVLPRSAGGGDAPDAEGAAASMELGRSSVDISSMTPREAADRLFRRVMQAAAADDSAEVVSFLPMALAAHDRARPLDLDGLFHLALLHRMAGQPGEALAAAERGLEADPDHLLALASAGAASAELGDTAGARARYEHLLSVWDDERAEGLMEYDAHRDDLPILRGEAEAFLGR